MCLVAAVPAEFRASALPRLSKPDRLVAAFRSPHGQPRRIRMRRTGIEPVSEDFIIAAAPARRTR